ncbi:hypothetical protein ACWDR9_14620 [Streptosporangium sandarakinum]
MGTRFTTASPALVVGADGDLVAAHPEQRAMRAPAAARMVAPRGASRHGTAPARLRFPGE